MALRHGKDTVVRINSTDISAFTNSTAMTDETDTNEVTCYGAARKAYIAGLGDGSFTIGGVHDDSIAGARAVIKPLKAAGTAVPFQYRPEGTGSGKAQSSVNVIVKSFNMSSPVAEQVAWTAELQMTGALDETNQP